MCWSPPSTRGPRSRRTPMADILVNDAIRATRHIDFDRVISRRDVDAGRGRRARSAVWRCSWRWCCLRRRPIAPADVVGSYLFPKSYAIEVMPGSTKVRAGLPLEIVARIPGIDGGLVPMLTVGTGADARSARMSPGSTPGEFTITLNNLTVSFPVFGLGRLGPIGRLHDRSDPAGPRRADRSEHSSTRTASASPRIPKRIPATSTRRPARRSRSRSPPTSR